MDNQTNLIETELTIDAIAAQQLKETAGWARFIAIMGFIYASLIVIGLIAAGTYIYGVNRSYVGMSGVIGGAGVGFVYFLMAGFVFFMSLCLFRYANNTKKAIETADQSSLIEGFRNMKIYFRLFGIVTIVALIFSALGIMGLLFVSTFSRS